MSKAKKLQSGGGWVLVRACPRCARPEPECRCGAALPAEDARPCVRLRLEKRNGKATTVLAASGIAAADFEALARELRSRCAAGGSARGAEAILQGDHREAVRALLAKRGIAAKG
jgi:translation initiation factor 1